MDRPKRSSQSLYDYQPEHAQCEQTVDESSSTPPSLTYDEIFKKVSFALAESISSSPKVSEPDPYLRDYLLRTSDLRRRASLSISSAPSPILHQRSSSRPRVHFSPEPISPEYIPLQSTGPNIDATVERSQPTKSSEEYTSRNRLTSLPIIVTPQLPPQRPRTTNSHSNPLLPPPPTGLKPRSISFPRPNRRRLSIDRLATETELPASPSPQTIELPPSPPPEFDFSEFEDCVNRQGYNLLDNLPVDTQSSKVEFDMTRPLIDLDGPTESPNPQSNYTCQSQQQQKNAFAGFSPLPSHEIYEPISSLWKNAFGDFSPLPSPTTYEPPLEFVNELLESPGGSDFFSSPYQTQSTRDRLRNQDIIESSNSNESKLKSPMSDNNVKLTQESDDDQKSGSTLRDCKIKTNPESAKAGEGSGGYSLFGLKSPIQLSQIIPAVTSLWASSSSNAVKVDSPVHSEKDEPVKTPISSRASTPSNNEVGTYTFSPAIELLSSLPRDSSCSSPKVSKPLSIHSEKDKPDKTPINSRAPTPSNGAVGTYIFSPAIELLSPPTRSATPCHARSPSVVSHPRTRSPSVATRHVRSSSVAPSRAAPVELDRPASASGSCCPDCEQRPSSAQSWTSYPNRPPSTQPEFSSRASRLSDLVTTVRRKALERADELDQMLATAIAREREFDELIEQMRKRERERSKDFAHLLVNWATRVPLPADDSHPPTPFIHHTFASNSDHLARSPALAPTDRPASQAPSVTKSATARSPSVCLDHPVLPHREHSLVRSPTAPSVVQSVSARSAAQNSRHQSVHSPPAVSHTPTSVNLNIPSASPVIIGSFHQEESVRSPAAASVRSQKAVSVLSSNQSAHSPAVSHTPTSVNLNLPSASPVIIGSFHQEESVRSPAAASVRSQKAVSVCSSKTASARAPTVVSVRSHKAASVISRITEHSPAPPVSVHSAGLSPHRALSRRGSVTGSSIRDEVSSRGGGKGKEMSRAGSEAQGERCAGGGDGGGGGGSNGGGSNGKGGGDAASGDWEGESVVTRSSKKDSNGTTNSVLQQPDEKSHEEEAQVDVKSVTGTMKDEQQQTPDVTEEAEKVEIDCEPVVAASLTVSHARSVMSDRESSSIKSGGGGSLGGGDGSLGGDGGSLRGGGGSLGGGGGGGGDTASLAPSSSSEDTGPAIVSILPSASNKPGKWCRQGPAGFKFVEI